MNFVLRAFDTGSAQVIHESGYHLCRVTGRSRKFTEVLSRQIALIEGELVGQYRGRERCAMRELIEHARLRERERRVEQPFLQRTDLPLAYVETGTIYIVRRETLAQGRLYGERIIGFPVSSLESLDIDTANDFAEAARIVAAGEAPAP